MGTFVNEEFSPFFEAQAKMSAFEVPSRPPSVPVVRSVVASSAAIAQSDQQWVQSIERRTELIRDRVRAGFRPGAMSLNEARAIWKDIGNLQSDVIDTAAQTNDDPALRQGEFGAFRLREFDVEMSELAISEVRLFSYATPAIATDLAAMGRPLPATIPIQGVLLASSDVPALDASEGKSFSELFRGFNLLRKVLRATGFGSLITELADLARDMSGVLKRLSAASQGVSKAIARNASDEAIKKAEERSSRAAKAVLKKLGELLKKVGGKLAAKAAALVAKLAIPGFIGGVIAAFLFELALNVGWWLYEKYLW